MNKIFQFIKSHFLTRKFLTFGIIGIANTLIHMSVYYVIYHYFFDEAYFISRAIVSNTTAFVSASIFSYFANAIFTFKPKNKSAVQFSIVMLVFIARWGISTSLTTFFDFAMLEWLHADYSAYSYLSIVAPFLASALLIPIAYFALDFVFRKTDHKKI